MKWAFDFATPSSNTSRRRSKRTGRSKRKHGSRNRDAQQHEMLGELCDKVTALSLDSGPTCTELWDSTTTIPLDTVRHRWEPRSCFEKIVEPSAPGNMFLQPDRYIPPTTTSPSLGARFSPLSAFLESLPHAAHQAPVSKPTHPIMSQISQTKETLARTPPTSAQEAVVPACQALATGKANTAALEEPLAFVHTSPLHSPGAQPSVYLHQQTPEPSHAKYSPPYPLSITSPHTAPPVLTPTSTSSPFRPMDFRPEHISSELPRPFPADSMTSADTAPKLYPYWYGCGQSRPSLLAAAPVTSLRQFTTLPEPCRTMLPPPPGMTSLDETLRWTLFTCAGPQRSQSAATRPVSVEDFLKMGHANPCWCSNCPNSVPLGDLPHEKAMATSKSESKETELGTLSANTSGERQHEEAYTDDAREKTDIQAIGTATQMEAADADPTPQPSSSSESGLGLEELTQSVCEAVMPGSDNVVSHSQENIWEIASARDDRSTRPQISTQPSQDTASELALTSEPGVLSMRTRSPALSDTAWTTTSFDFELDSSYEEVVEALRPNTPHSPLFLWPSPSNSPALTPILPSRLPRTSVPSPTLIRRSTSPVLPNITSNIRFI
jgi:hypothetical protein